MATPTSLIHIPFAGGINEGDADEHVDPVAGFTTLQNVRQDRRGSLTKRPGYASLALTRLDATSRSAGNRMFSHGKQLCVIDGSTLDVYSGAASVNVNTTRVSSCEATTVDVPTMSWGGASSFEIRDVCLVGSYIVACLQTTSGVYAVVYDKTSGEIVRPLENISANNWFQIASHGAYAYIFGQSTLSTTINMYVLNTTSSSTVNSGWTTHGTSFTSGTSSFEKFSVASLEDRVAIAYSHTTSGTDRITVKTINAGGTVVETATINTSSVTPDLVAIEGTVAGTLWVAWNESTDVKVKGLDADSLASTLATTATVVTVGTAPTANHYIDVCGNGGTSGQVFVNNGDSGGFTYQSYIRGFTTSAGAVSASGSTSTVYNCKRIGRMFYANSRYFALCTNDNVAGSSKSAFTAVCDVTHATLAVVRPEATTLPALSGGYPGAHAPVASSVAWVPVIATTAQTDVYAPKLLKLDFSSSARWLSCERDKSTYLSGGVLTTFDGNKAYENGFVVRPPTPTAVESGSGSSLSVGNYSYVVTYEHIDANGNWHVSSVSNPVTLGVISSRDVTLTFRPLSISGRIDAATSQTVRVGVYRTLVGASPPYYLVTTQANTLSASTQVYTDGTSDATLATKRKLFAPSLPGVNGSAQDRRQPPHFQAICTYNGMVVGASDSVLWYSGQSIDGEAAWFNPIFTVPIEGGGRITALVPLDGTLFVFKEREIYAVSGDPPSDNGASGGLGSPRRISSDVGCTQPNSVVASSAGVFFRSGRGIELLSRSLQVVWVGEPVGATLASYPYVMGAVLDDVQGLVRFSLAASVSSGRASGNGVDLVYDLGNGVWQSVDVKTGTASTQPSQSAAMVYYSGSWRYGWLAAGGTVYYERDSSDGSAHLDGSTWITMAVQTGWIKLSGIQGRHHVNKVLLLARKHTSSALDTYLTYDYAQTPKTVMTRTYSTIDSLSSALDRVQVEHQLHSEAEGQSFRVKYSDATPSGGTVGTGKGATWIAITVEGTPKAGAAAVPSTGQ